MKTIPCFKTLVLTMVLSTPWFINAQDNFYDLSAIQEIEISFSQSNWDYILDTAKAGSGSYLMAQWVKINGVQYDSAGVKYKGSSSYDPTFAKNPLHISLDEFKNQSYQGFTSIKLANFYGDPSMIREPLAYSILANYMDCSRSNFATVTINGTFIGLYSNDESVNKKFCSTHFYSSGNTFIKGSPVLPGPFSRSDLKYISSDSSDYFGKYELESDHGWNDLVDLCYMLKYDIGSIEGYIDIDRALWMLAFNNVLVSLDSYSGWFAQNHYLYKDNTGHFDPVIWDLNMAFGGFPFAGTQGGGSGSLTVEQMKQMVPLLHDNHNDWPLIFVLMSNPEWRNIYIAHMRTIITDHFQSDSYTETALAMRNLIDGTVQADPNKFFTYEQFLQAMTTDITFGSYVIPGIENLMSARADFLLNSEIFSEVPPQISAVLPVNPVPGLGEEVTVNATVNGEGPLNVFLGVRHDKEDKFVRQDMYDDGNHNDGAAGDGNYGASFTMSTLTAHYYIYAEIDDLSIYAATFSPEQAEFSYYTLEADLPTAQPGDVVINEFLARNNNDTVNEYGNHEDWIELINLTGEPLDLFGLYLTDDFDNPDKFSFPENTTIEPEGYLMIWADEEDTVSSFLHANFKLSGDGEKLMLSDGAGMVLDSLSFGPQSADISFGRCPDGSGYFSALEYPTFSETNYCPEYISDQMVEGGHFIVMPNPSRGDITLISEDPGILTAELYHSSGVMVAKINLESGKAMFQGSDLPAGIYFILLRNDRKEVLSSGKVVRLE